MEELRQGILNQQYMSSQSSNSSYQNSNSSYQISNNIIDSIICKSIKKIGEHTISKIHKKNREKKYTAELISEIQNIFISYGTNNKLIIYDDSYEKICSLQTREWIYNILYYKSKINKAVDIIASSKKKLYIYNKIKNKYELMNELIIENNLLYLLSMGTYYISCCENTVFLCASLFDKLQGISKISIYENILMKSAIKINDNLIVFKSNKIASKGKSQLFLYNFRIKLDIQNFIKKSKENKEEYSFLYSPLGQALIIHNSKDPKEKAENRVLLFACKKYIKRQKNGIFALYNINQKLETQRFLSEKDKADSYFYNTKNFEPFCICPLLIVIESKYKIEPSVLTKESDYFLVGGFEKKTKQGLIKLYKIKYEEKLSIEYIQDIKLFDKYFKGFKGPISCITQSKKDGNLLITCWDGNVYLVNKPDISFYLKQDKEIEKSAIDFFPPKFVDC